MKIIERYDYEDLQNIDRPDGRVYVDPHGNELPSVTTILSATKDMTVLDAWRKRIGEDEANRQIKHAVNVGNLMHESVERRLYAATECSGLRIRRLRFRSRCGMGGQRTSSGHGACADAVSASCRQGTPVA